MSFKILVSLDILAGRVVRLVKGQEDALTEYSDDPVAVARFWIGRGFDGLHIVDLDAALGRGNNWPVIDRVLSLRGIFKEVGGGIRDISRIEMMLSNGADRVVLGTGAIKGTIDLGKIKQKDRTVIALDKLGNSVAIEGWKATENRHPLELLPEFLDMGFTNFLITNVEADGTKRGINTEDIISVSPKYRSYIYLSGGILFDDLEAVKSLGYAGAIIGKAAYDKFLSGNGRLE